MCPLACTIGTEASADLARLVGLRFDVCNCCRIFRSAVKLRQRACRGKLLEKRPAGSNWEAVVSRRTKDFVNHLAISPSSRYGPEPGSSLDI